MFEHESNLGFRLETLSGGVLENGVRISEIRSQKSLSRFDCLTIFNGEIIFASEREFEVTFRFRHMRMDRIPILRRIGDDLMRFFASPSSESRSGILPNHMTENLDLLKSCPKPIDLNQNVDFAGKI